MRFIISFLTFPFKKLGKAIAKRCIAIDARLKDSISESTNSNWNNLGRAPMLTIVETLDLHAQILNQAKLDLIDAAEAIPADADADEFLKAYREIIKHAVIAIDAGQGKNTCKMPNIIGMLYASGSSNKGLGDILGSLGGDSIKMPEREELAREYAINARKMIDGAIEQTHPNATFTTNIRI